MTLDVGIASPSPAPAPVIKPDMRPTADAAAVARDTTPELALPIPASNGQSGAVTASKVGASSQTELAQAVEETERVLKPYGVAMLPEMADQTAQQEEADAEADEENAQIEAETAETSVPKEADSSTDRAFEAQKAEAKEAAPTPAEAKASDTRKEEA